MTVRVTLFILDRLILRLRTPLEDTGLCNISLPKFEWWYLREHFPLKYENKVNPVPKADEWFHAKVVIDGRKITVFVNNSTLPSLEIEKLTDTKSGEIGLWDSGGEHESDANFANLVIIPKKK